MLYEYLFSHGIIYFAFGILVLDLFAHLVLETHEPIQLMP